MTTPSSQSSYLTTGENPVNVLYFSNELPSDDLRELARCLHVHSKDRRHLHLAAFLEQALIAVKSEAENISPALKKLLPPLESILTLTQFPELRRGPLSGAIEGVLLLVIELSTFIGFHEISDAEFKYHASNSILCGLGMGMLASSVISVSPTLANLVVAGAEAVRVAFRMGIYVDRVSSDLESQETGSGPNSWAYVITGCDVKEVQAELNAWNKEQKTSEPNKIFISALSANSVTVSGPPSRLKKIFGTSKLLRHSKHIALPVFGGLCHAPHIYTREDARKIVNKESLEELDARLSPRIPVLSTGDGEKFPSNSVSGLFEDVVCELLTGTITWSKVLSSLAKRATFQQSSLSQIFVYRLTHGVKEIESSLKTSNDAMVVRVSDLVSWVSNSKQEDKTPRGTQQSKIAIVGMSCRLPGGADDPELFWELLEDGKDVHQRVPADRFDIDLHFDPTGKRINTSLTPFGCFLNQPGLFDAGFFNISPREALETDAMQRLALVTAYEALEQSGYVPNRTSSTKLSRIGTFYGQASDDYREVNSAQDVDTYFISGGCRAFGPGRINYFFKFSGPSFSCDTACSSSLATIQIACTSLWAGDADMVVAGGMNVLTNSDAFAGLSRGHFLSKTGSCKTWDCDADGYCRGDGIGSIVLKRLEDAEADNDNILGVILASATNHSADAISITHPHAGAQSDLYKQVINRAGISATDVSFCELHGTGTQAGDSIEIESISNFFAPSMPSRPAHLPLHIGAVKANIGHGEAVAGVTALIKVLLMLEKEAIPPHVGIKTAINPAFPKDLEKRNLKIPFTKTAWPRVPGKKRRAFVNNFSAAGGNTSLLLEEGPVRERDGIDPRPSFIVAVSARSKVSLAKNLARLISHLDENADLSLPDLSYTTCARRIHHNHRLSVTGSTIAAVKKSLTLLQPGAETHRPVSTVKPTVAFAFTGQGAFYNGVGKQLYTEFPVFRAEILRLDNLVQSHGFPSIIPAIEGDVEDDHEFPPVITQLTIVCSEIALARFWETLGVKPSVVIGASLGEYAALNVAGVLSASDAIFLAGARAECLKRECQIGTHSMMAVRATADQIKGSLGARQPYEVACHNTLGDICISGPREDITSAKGILEEDGYKCHQLNVPYAFHSAQMDPVLEKFEAIASSVIYKTPKVPVLSPLLGECVFDGNTINGKYMSRATREPVQFPKALLEGQSMGLISNETVWVDIGPHPVAGGFVKSVIPGVRIATPSLRRDENNWTTLTQSISILHGAGLDLNWDELYHPFEASLSLLRLPAYSWNAKNYWLQYEGDWMLTKNQKPDPEIKTVAEGPSSSKLTTSTIHHIIEEDIGKTTGRLVIRSNVLHPDFLAAANGHRMNNCGVVTSSIHADLGYTLAEYLYKQIRPKTSKVHMNFTDLEVLQGLIARKDRSKPQWIQVTAVADLEARTTSLQWHNVLDDGELDDGFASAVILYGDADLWLEEWDRNAHLVNGRIEALEQMARDGTANKLGRNMAYTLFNNLVDYAEKYRGMHSVVLNGYEAYADVVLAKEPSGTWTLPPFYIDSVVHVSGFIMNGSDAFDHKATFAVTPGWESMRFAKPLVPGGKYRSYVKMLPMKEPTWYSGDVYVLQGTEIIGKCGGIKFRTFPRQLLSVLFSPPDVKAKNAAAIAHASSTPAKQAGPPSAPPKAVVHAPAASRTKSEAKEPEPPAPQVPQNPVKAEVVDVQGTEPSDEPEIVTRALAIISEETALEIAELEETAEFATIGVDSLLSLVLSEKFRNELKIDVRSSLFLECRTVGDLKAWLIEYC